MYVRAQERADGLFMVVEIGGVMSANNIWNRDSEVARLYMASPMRMFAEKMNGTTIRIFFPSNGENTLIVGSMYRKEELDKAIERMKEAKFQYEDIVDRVEKAKNSPIIHYEI